MTATPARATAFLSRIAASRGRRTPLILGLLTLLAFACDWPRPGHVSIKPLNVQSPSERVQKIAALISDYEQQGGSTRQTMSEGDEITVSGRIVTADGGPLPGKGIPFDIQSQLPRYCSNTYANAKPNGEFSTKVGFGAIHLSCAVPGYAYAWVGPFQTRPGGKIENVRIELRKGFRGEIKVADPQGRPIPGVRFEGYYNTPVASHPYLWSDRNRNPLTTNEQGVAVIDNALTMTLSLTVQAPGFEEAYWPAVQLSPGRPALLTMTPAQPTEISVVAAEGGKPVPGAELHLLSARGGISHGSGPDYAPVIATADKDGRIRLDTLRRDSIYFGYVAAKGYSKEVLRGFSAGQNLRAELKPAFHVQGRLLGVERAEKYKGKPVLYFAQQLSIEHGEYQWRSQPVELKVENGVGRFEFDAHWGGELTISSGDFQTNVVLNAPAKELELDLRSQLGQESTPVTRDVTLSLDLPPGAPPPAGRIMLSYHAAPGKKYVRKWFPLTGSEVKLQAAAPTTLEYDGEQVAGYWLPRNYSGFSIPTTPASVPFAIKVPATPAGALTGRLLEPDGQPARDVLISVIEVQSSPLKPKGGSYDMTIGLGPSSACPPGRFLLSPLPLLGKYVAMARRGDAYLASKPITLTERNPICELTFTFPEGVTINGRVTDESGKPLAGVKYRLDYRIPNHGFGGNERATDGDGRFTFQHLIFAAPGEYTLQLESPGFQSRRFKLEAEGKPLEIVMKKSAPLLGVAIDADTGKPLPEFEVNAAGTIRDEFAASFSATTNRSGEFRIEGLDPAQRYRLESMGGKIEPEVVATPGSGSPVTLRVKLAEWEKQRRARGGY